MSIKSETDSLVVASTTIKPLEPNMSHYSVPLSSSEHILSSN